MTILFEITKPVPEDALIAALRRRVSSVELLVSYFGNRTKAVTGSVFVTITGLERDEEDNTWKFKGVVATVFGTELVLRLGQCIPSIPVFKDLPCAGNASTQKAQGQIKVEVTR